MRQLLPTPLDTVDPLDLYLADARPRPSDRPWLMTNMIASVDGATAIDGLSGDLGGPADKAVFRAIRASCDWVLVASATAIAERYRRPGTDADLTARRAALGRPPAPRLAIATASGRLDPDMPAFTEPSDNDRPLVVTGTDADTDALARIDAEIVVVPAATPSPEAILAALGERGADVVLSEGGPRFNGMLHAADLFDEVCLSLSPTLVGGDASRILHGGAAHASSLRLDRLLESEGLLFSRYVRHR